MKNLESSRSVQVFIEIGHRAWCRSPETRTNDKTHDWVLFVRGNDGNDGIHHFIEKVIFYLHDSFKKPTRVIKEPPFKVAESGYGIFTAKIEVYFQMKKECQSKQIYTHELTLPQETDPPIEHSLTEKLTFNNVSEDFIQRVLKGGGTLIDGRDTAPMKTRDFEHKAAKKSRKHLDAISSTPQSISPDLKSCSKEIEKRQLEMSLFGEPEVIAKKVRSEGTNSPLTVEKNSLKKKSYSEVVKAKKSKISIKEVKSEARLSMTTGYNSKQSSKGELNKRVKTEQESTEVKIKMDVHDENLSIEKKKAALKPIETHEDVASSDNFESDLDLEKDVMTSGNEDEHKLVALSGLPYYELETIYSKVMSLNPEDNDELMMSYKIYKILQTTGKGYNDDGVCFDLHQLDLPIILQIKDIIQC